MKMVWVYVMLGSMVGFVAVVIGDLAAVLPKVLAVLFGVSGLAAFFKAKKLGEEEDRVKAQKDKQDLSV